MKRMNMVQVVKQTREEMIKMYMKASKKELASMLAMRDELEQPNETSYSLKTTDEVYSFDPKDILGHDPLTFEQMKEIEDLHLQHDWKKLRHQAAVSALSGIVAAIPKDVQGNYAEFYADEAICIADSLVKKLIKMEEEE